MIFQTLTREQKLPVPRETAWEFFSSPRNLDEITPPDIGFKIIGDVAPKMHEGQVITYRIRILPFIRVKWITRILEVKEGVHFVDNQEKGPYKFWHHLHTFEDIPGGVLMRDIIHYGIGFGPFGKIAHFFFVRRKLESIFDYRRVMITRRFGSMCLFFAATCFP